MKTFLVCLNYRKSASYLDRWRLGKQRVEAYQLLCLIEDLNYLGKKFNNPRPKETSEWKDWIEEIKIEYSQLKYQYVVQKSTKKYIKVLKILTTKMISEEYRLVTLRWAKHPQLRAWLNWPDSLKEYITAHIEEWESRNYKNNMQKYEISSAERPPWTEDKKMHKIDRAALYEKETGGRKLPKGWKPCYINKKIFQEAGSFEGYVWPY